MLIAEYFEDAKNSANLYPLAHVPTFALPAGTCFAISGFAAAGHWRRQVSPMFSNGVAVLRLQPTHRAHREEECLLGVGDALARGELGHRLKVSETGRTDNLRSSERRSGEVRGACEGASPEVFHSRTCLPKDLVELTAPLQHILLGRRMRQVKPNSPPPGGETRLVHEAGRGGAKEAIRFAGYVDEVGNAIELLPLVLPCHALKHVFRRSP